mmetsp:Transcript_31297/g.102491  ORF Transcript_31297/g.102491 Transcript_31297/m.102491 type:complete len:337 (+) Transcript_31297:201-1211(+)
MRRSRPRAMASGPMRMVCLSISRRKSWLAVSRSIAASSASKSAPSIRHSCNAAASSRCCRQCMSCLKTRNRPSSRRIRPSASSMASPTSRSTCARPRRCAGPPPRLDVRAAGATATGSPAAGLKSPPHPRFKEDQRSPLASAASAPGGGASSSSQLSRPLSVSSSPPLSSSARRKPKCVRSTPPSPPPPTVDAAASDRDVPPAPAPPASLEPTPTLLIESSGPISDSPRSEWITEARALRLLSESTGPSSEEAWAAFSFAAARESCEGCTRRRRGKCGIQWRRGTAARAVRMGESWSMRSTSVGPQNGGGGSSSPMCGAIWAAWGAKVAPREARCP